MTIDGVINLAVSLAVTLIIGIGICTGAAISNGFWRGIGNGN